MIFFILIIAMNPQLTIPFTMLVAASSNAGKSELIRDMLINHYLMFEKPLEEIIWLYHKNAKEEELFSNLTDNINVPITFIEGFPAKDISDGTLFKSDKNSIKCLVLDDVVVSALRSPIFIDLFTVLSHHMNIVVIAILQNIHAHSPAQRQLMNNVIRNVSYIVLFPDRRQMAAVRQIAHTYYNSEEAKLLEPFKQLIESKQKHDYMLIDFVGNENQVRFNCLRPETRKYFFSKPV